MYSQRRFDRSSCTDPSCPDENRSGHLRRWRTEWRQLTDARTCPRRPTRVLLQLDPQRHPGRLHPRQPRIPAHRRAPRRHPLHVGLANPVLGQPDRSGRGIHHASQARRARRVHRAAGIQDRRQIACCRSSSHPQRKSDSRDLLRFHRRRLDHLLRLRSRFRHHRRSGDSEVDHALGCHRSQRRSPAQSARLGDALRPDRSQAAVHRWRPR